MAGLILFLLAILFVAALPFLLVFVFLEINAKKQAKARGETVISDSQYQLAKLLGWAIFAFLIVLLILSSFDSEEQMHYSSIFKIIGAIFHFLK